MIQSRLARWAVVLACGIVAWLLPMSWTGMEPTHIAMLKVGIYGVVAAVLLGGWQRWQRLMSHREPGTALALFRIAVGACVLLTVGGVAYWDLVDVLWVDRDHGGYRELSGRWWLIQLLGGPTPSAMWGLVWGSLFGGVLMIVGLGGRVTAFWTLMTFIAATDVNGHAGGSYDELLSNALWIVVLAPSTETLSLDSRIWNGKWISHRWVPAWPRYLVIYQLVLCYWTTGLQKVSTYWIPGGDFMALYYILQQPSWHRMDMSWLAWIVPLTQLGTAVSWFWEILCPLWLLTFWYRATRSRPGRLRAFSNSHDLRTLYAVVGVTFHLLIWMAMDVGPFTWVSLAFYVCLYHPDEWRLLGQRLRQRWSGLYAATRRLGNQPV